MALKVLTTGDIHIGKKSSSVNPDAEESASKFSWNNIVDYAIKNKVDVLALTGDIVDQDNRYFEAIGPLQTGFEKLKQADISVYMVAGNHDFDVLPELVGSNKYNNVHFLGANGTWEMKKFSKNGEKLQVVGWSFPKRHFNEDPFSTYRISGIDPNIPTIGLLHGDFDNPYSNYAPLGTDSFLRRSVDVWVLGHIHKPQVLREFEPTIYYPGSPHALSAKEQGVHGPVLLTVQSLGGIQREKISLSPVRYARISVDITDKSNKESIRDTITSKIFEDARAKIMDLEAVYFLVYDVNLIGQHNKIKDLEIWTRPIIDDYDQELSTTETRISVRKIRIEVQPKVENMEELARESSPAGVLAQTILALESGETTTFAENLIKEWKTLQTSATMSGAYQPLGETDRFEIGENLDPKQYLLTECNRILTELIGQQAQ